MLKDVFQNLLQQQQKEYKNSVKLHGAILHLLEF